MSRRPSYDSQSDGHTRVASDSLTDALETATRRRISTAQEKTEQAREQATKLLERRH